MDDHGFSAASEVRTPPGAGLLPIRGVLLRSVLLVELDRARGRPVSVAELVTAVRRQGFSVVGRTSKVVSDALRCEVTRGRARRAGRGWYRVGDLPRTTRWRARRRIADARAGVAPPHHLGRAVREEGPGALPHREPTTADETHREPTTAGETPEQPKTAGQTPDEPTTAGETPDPWLPT